MPWLAARPKYCEYLRGVCPSYWTGDVMFCTCRIPPMHWSRNIILHHIASYCVILLHIASNFYCIVRGVKQHNIGWRFCTMKTRECECVCCCPAAIVVDAEVHVTPRCWPLTFVWSLSLAFKSVWPLSLPFERLLVVSVGLWKQAVVKFGRWEFSVVIIGRWIFCCCYCWPLHVFGRYRWRWTVFGRYRWPLNICCRYHWAFNGFWVVSFVLYVVLGVNGGPWKAWWPLTLPVKRFVAVSVGLKRFSVVNAARECFCLLDERLAGDLLLAGPPWRARPQRRCGTYE